MTYFYKKVKLKEARIEARNSPDHQMSFGRLER